MNEHRVDWTIVADIGALTGAICVAVGLYQLHSPLLLIWIGIALIVASIIAVLPATQKRSEPPALPALTHERIGIEV